MKKKRSDPASLLDGVVENGLQFIEMGLDQLWTEGEKHHLKYSVINFYTGVELLLKARLMMEHWALVVSELKHADSEKFLSGDFKSVGLDETNDRLKKIAGYKLPQATIRTFNSLQKHRNQMVHFFHPTNLRSKAGKKLKSQVVTEQCAGWFFLRRLIGEAWKGEFKKYQSRIDRANVHMKRHKNYLHTVYKQIEPELKAEVSKGADLGHCYSCGYAAHVIDEVGPCESKCRVCTAYGSFLRHDCKSCPSTFLIDDGFESPQPCPHCDEPVTRDELLEAYSTEGQMTGKEFHTEGGYGSCAECSGYHTVGTISEDWSFCFCCLQFQAPMGVCEWCNENSTGDLETSYTNGCAICDGKWGWDSS